ncbi:DAK2 domain-containing protein [Halanaerobium saccharolyticum]|uniref:DAK2 domain-containing protein n=1 Tax=Halanaerobium saccharolyticum TaxID=43595 RepID=UPI003FCD884D
MPINNKEKITAVDAEQFKDMMFTSLYWLKEQKSFIDSLNVFPVPDGDTGTNMYLTFKEAVSSLEGKSSRSVSELAAALSKGALMGARGNSGVILSQLIRGFAQALKNKKKMKVKDLANALSKASEVAYHGVLKPVEGTILTVSREAAEKAQAEMDSAADIIELFEITIKAAEESLERTPELLAALKEAEVVDAGGQGYLTILEGMLKGLKGEKIEYQAAEADTKTRKKSELAEDIKFTYCTQMLIEIDSRKSNIDRMIDRIRKDMQSYGDSIMVVGSDDVIKIHVHTNHPGVLLEYGLKKGKVFDIKIDNMRKQNQEKVQRENDTDFDHSKFHQDKNADSAVETKEDNQPAEVAEKNELETAEVSEQEDSEIVVEKNTGIISVANGEGVVNILKELGVDYVIKGGQSMNPSTNDFLEVVERMNTDQIIILPNNKNIISAAKQVSELSEKEIAIIETRSIPQAVTALMIFDDQASPADLKESMEAEIKYVKTLEITQAVKDSKVNGLEIKKDNYIGLKDGDILVSADTERETVINLLNKVAEDEELVTIYYGEGITEAEAEEIKAIMEENFDFDEIEIYPGGQPLYPFIISLE